MMTYLFCNLKDLRRRAGLTQSELAKMAGVSQSLIAKIENKQVDPRISTYLKILRPILDKLNLGKLTIDEILRIKVQNSLRPKLVHVKPDSTISRAIYLMEKYGISCLPVLKSRKSIGCVDYRTILKKVRKKELDVNQLVETIMKKSLPVIDSSISFLDAYMTLMNNDAILVGNDETIVGIITPRDLLLALYLKYFQQSK